MYRLTPLDRYRRVRLRRAIRLVLVFAWLGISFFPQDRRYDRSIAITDRGIAATCPILASGAGAQIPAKGGSARR